MSDGTTFQRRLECVICRQRIWREADASAKYTYCDDCLEKNRAIMERNKADRLEFNRRLR